MKRFLLYTVLFLLCQIGYGQVTVIIELTADGQAIGTDEDAFSNDDLEWTVTDLNTGCVVAEDEAYEKGTVVAGGVDAGGVTVMMIDMNVFDACKAAQKGDELVFEMKVINPSNRFYGYTTRTSFIVPAGSSDGLLPREYAINFTAPANGISLQ